MTLRLRRSTCWALLAAMVASPGLAHACTSIIVSRGASKDGSVLVTYSADAPFMPRLLRVAGGEHPAGSMVDVKGWENDRINGQIPQAARTYTVVGLMNENQVSMGETTTGGRRELVDRKGQLDYDALMSLTLQRARSAREAIKIVDQLANEYGYGSSGETFSIADKDEAWLMELIGKGPGRKGIVWVAARVPDGCITAHANLSRITTFPLDDPENWLYSPDVVQFAIDRGFYSTGSGKPFSYRDAYHPNIGASQKRACAGRVWSIYRRSSPSSNFSDAWFRGAEGVEDYPLFIKPDKPLAVQDVMALMRDHLRGDALRHDQGDRRRPVRQPGPVPRPRLHGRRQALHVGAADLDPAGGVRHRLAEPQEPARRRRRRHLVHARRGVDLVLHPACIATSTPCPNPSSWATTGSSRSTRPGGSGTSSRT